MKSRAGQAVLSPLSRALPVLFLLTAAVGLRAAPAGPAADPASWVLAVRAGPGLPGLAGDPVLTGTAASYAEELAARGAISHRGADGSDALTRYLRRGGTCARVGEIIGAGPTLQDVEKAWLGSPTHRGVIMAPYWTGVGWGKARAGNATVWVVLFLQRRVEGLTVSRVGGTMRVEGRLIPVDAEEPVLLSGTARVPADAWDPLSKSFSFTVLPGLASGYVRLGYIARGGGIVITDVLTSPRGRGSPGE